MEIYALDVRVIRKLVHPRNLAILTANPKNFAHVRFVFEPVAQNWRSERDLQISLKMSITPPAITC